METNSPQFSKVISISIANKTNERITMPLFDAVIPDGLEVKWQSPDVAESYADFKRLGDKPILSSSFRMTVQDMDEYMSPLYLYQHVNGGFSSIGIMPLYYLHATQAQGHLIDVPNYTIFSSDRQLLVPIEPNSEKQIDIIVHSEGDLESLIKIQKEKNKNYPQNGRTIIIENTTDEAKEITLFDKDFVFPEGVNLVMSFSKYEYLLQDIEWDKEEGKDIRDSRLYFNKLKVYSKNASQISQPLKDISGKYSFIGITPEPNFIGIEPRCYRSAQDYLDCVVDCDITSDHKDNYSFDIRNPHKVTIEPKTKVCYFFYDDRNIEKPKPEFVGESC